ncbi:MAG TPA: hypothetical protein PLV42_09920 [bacterium]|nr:hypothetical protein [bacterium]
MRKSLFAVLIGMLLSLGCDVISTDISVSYPFDENKPEEYAISIDEAMNNLNTAVTAQTRTLVGLKVDTSAFPAGADITVNTTLSLDNLIAFLGGQDSVVKISVTATHASLPQPVIEEQSITFSICDFVTFKSQGVSTEFSFADVHMEILGLDTYCPAKTGAVPYIFITHRNVPKPIALSENKQMKEYKSLLNKIRSATLDQLKLTITQPLNGVTFGEDAASGDSKISMSAALFAQPVKDCTGTEDAMTCTGVDFTEEQKPADFYAGLKDPFTGIDPYWIGNFGNSQLTAGGVLDLVYTYDGKNILQEAIKNLDFQIGIKSWYKITPGSTKPSGVLKATVSATFFFSVEPLR